jgi:hypothetical protein
MRIRIRELFDPAPGMEKFGSRINIPDNTANSCNNLSYLPLNPSDLSEYRTIRRHVRERGGERWSQMTTGNR